MLVHEPEVDRSVVGPGMVCESNVESIGINASRRRRRRLFRDQLFLVCRHLPMSGEIDYFFVRLLWEFVRFSRWSDPIEFAHNNRSSTVEPCDHIPVRAQIDEMLSFLCDFVLVG